MNIAFIPVRGGSKSIPLKNIKQICGQPLIYWTAKAACSCTYIDKVFISTDSEIIKDTVENFKIGLEADVFSKMEVVGRSQESASDVASTEYAMVEFAENHEFNNIVLIQATSPLLQKNDLDRGFEAFGEDGTDSVISVVRQKRFHWEIDEKGYAHPTNYDVFNRPRRQEFSGYLVENGAFYICRKADLLKYNNRVSGNIKAVEMKENTFFEIDEPDDWVVMEALMKKNDHVTSEGTIPNIKMFLTDCDGCMTDGGMYYSENGDELKKFNTRDGMGFSLLHKMGVITGIITAEQVKLNQRRAEKLNVDIIEMGCIDKAAVVKHLCNIRNISLKNVAYIGDDLNDIEVMKIVGFSCCPNDAQPEIKRVAKYVAKTSGGHGVIREVVGLLLNRQ